MNNMENIQLVKLVEQHKCLWDKFCDQHQNKEAVNAAWEIIAEDVRKPSSFCRSQWRNIRNTYLRSLHKSTGKEYYLSQYMKFLQPRYEMRESSRTPTVSSMSSVSSSMSFDGGFMSSNTPLSRSYSSNSFRSFHGGSNCDEENTHMIFFKSLLPDLENMNDRQVRKFRCDIIGLIDNVFQDDNISTPAGATTADFNHYSNTSGAGQVTSPQPMMTEQDEIQMLDHYLQELSTASSTLSTSAPAGGTTTVLSVHPNLNDNNQNTQGMINSMPYNMRQI